MVLTDKCTIFFFLIVFYICVASISVYLSELRGWSFCKKVAANFCSIEKVLHTDTSAERSL